MRFWISRALRLSREAMLSAFSRRFRLAYGNNQEVYGFSISEIKTRAGLIIRPQKTFARLLKYAGYVLELLIPFPAVPCIPLATIYSCGCSAHLETVSCRVALADLIFGRFAVG